MPKYLCIQRSLPQASGNLESKPSAAQMQEIYAKFGAWQAKFKTNIVDMGGKLGAGRLVTAGDIDGPFIEAKELIGGYMIVEAADLDSAIEVARECPGLVRPGSGVEVIAIHAP